MKGFTTRIKNSKGSTFIRAYVMYTICVLMYPTTQRHVGTSYIGLVADIYRIKWVNFALPTLNHLMPSIAKFKDGSSNLEGNLPLLQVRKGYKYMNLKFR